MKILETERLILRKFVPEDFAAVDRYASVRENIIYMPWGPNSEADTRAFIARAISAAETVPQVSYQYAAVLVETGALIGGCDLSLKGDKAELGWIVNREYWGRGLAPEMGRALLALGFEDLGVHRVVARCDAENRGSYRAMEKIGMRREGLFIEARPAGKNSSRKYGDELRYAITRDEWETNAEIARYNALPCRFDGFIDLPELTDGVIRLVCLAKHPAIPEKQWVPLYDFAICLGSERVGGTNLRIGYGGGPSGSNLYYGGQIGYEIDERYRGNGYAGRACRLLAPVARAHDMRKLLITNVHTNDASRRVCEKLGARLLRLARLPEWHDLYKEGQRFVNVFEWNI